MPVTYQVQHPHFRLKNEGILTHWLLVVSFLEQREVNGLGFVFCTDDFLYRLNMQYLHHDEFTDIVTFDYSAKGPLMAEIYISIDRVRDNAKKYSQLFENELNRVIVHGLLHCCGYSDRSGPLKARMRRAEDRYLAILENLR